MHSRGTVKVGLFASGLMLSGFSSEQMVDLSVHGFRSDVTVPISDLTKRSLEYAYMHVSQATGMDFAGGVLNQGPDTAYNVIVQVNAQLDGTDLGTFASDTLPFLVPGGSDTLPIHAGVEVSLAYAVLSLQFNVTSESLDTVIANDQDSIGVRIDQYRFIRPEREWSDTIGTGMGGSITYVRYEVVEPEAGCEVVCIIPYNPELVGWPIVGALYDEEFTLLMEREVTLSQSGMSEPGEANWFHISFLEPTELEPGHDYYAAVQTFGGIPITIAAGGPCPDSSVFRYDPTTDVWSILDQTPIIGLIMGGNCFEGIEEHPGADVVLSHCVPDPASTITTLDYANSGARAVRFEMRNATGALVHVERLGVQLPGEHTFDLDVSTLPAGVYAYSLVLDDARATRRMVVVH